MSSACSQHLIFSVKQTRHPFTGLEKVFHFFHFVTHKGERVAHSTELPRKLQRKEPPSLFFVPFDA